MAIDYGSMYGSANDVQGFGIGNAPVINSKPFPVFNKPSPAPVTTVSYNPPAGPVGNAPIINKPFPTLKPPKPTGGGLSFSFGGGGGGGSAPAGPNVSLTPQTFAPYESTYTPPTPATPVPYDYATRSPYVYGDGLSNAGAAYDIWGSKPGTNPYLLSTPADYTPGILGLDPVTLPGNMPNKGANINALSNVKQKDTRTPAQQQWDRIAAYASQEALPKQELKMASDQYAARYGNEIFNNDKASLAKMFPETNWDDFATPELRNKNQVKEFRTLTPPKKAPAPTMTKAAAKAVTSKMDRDYSPPSQPKKYATTTYTAKKQSTAKAVKT